MLRPQIDPHILTDFEVQLLESRTKQPISALLTDEGDLYDFLSAQLSQPLVDYESLSPLYHSLFSAAFSMSGVSTSEQIDRELSELRCYHYFESTAFIALIAKMKKKRVVPPFPPADSEVDREAAELWRSAVSLRPLSINLPLTYHYHLELVGKQPFSQVNVSNNIVEQVKADIAETIHDRELRSLGSLLVTPLKRIFARSK